MVDYNLIQNRLDRGYAKASAVLGPPYQQYRAVGPNNPLATPMGAVDVWATTDAALKGTTPMQFGKAQWFGALERDNVQVGDYLVGQLGTFFVASTDYPGPVGLVYCNRIIGIARALDALPQGASLQRFGTAIQTAQAFMSGWPASVLQLSSGSKMGSTGLNLPSDAKLPGIAILLPATTPMIQFNDVVTDDLGRRYMLASAELSTLGWRLTGELQPSG